MYKRETDRMPENVTSRLNGPKLTVPSAQLRVTAYSSLNIAGIHAAVPESARREAGRQGETETERLADKGLL